MKKRRYPRDELGRFAEAKKSVKAPARKPAKAPARKPAKAPARKPAKAPARKPVKAPARKPAKAPARKPVKAPARKLAKAPARKPVKAPARKPAKAPARKPAKAPARKPAKAPARKPAKAPARKPVKAPARKPAKAPARKPAKAPARKPAKAPARKPAKAPARKPVKAPVRESRPRLPFAKAGQGSRSRKPVKAPVPVPAKKKRRKKRKKYYRDEHGHFIEKPAPESPLVAERSIAAESLMQSRLVELLDLVSLVEPGLDMSVQTMANEDGTVDGELRISNLPGDWREPGGAAMMAAVLSSAFRTWDLFPARPPMGGAYWVTFGVRFGPQNEAEVGELAELYKRFRGLFQVGTYPTPAWISGSIQVALTTDNTSLKSMVRSIVEKRGYPPSVLLVRFVWTPDATRPGHYKGEK